MIAGFASPRWRCEPRRGGTTAAGGTGNCTNLGLSGCGTVFELTPPAASGGGWTKTVLYSFAGVPRGRGDSDAASPNSLIFDGAGDLYGFADDGGHCFTNETGTNCHGAAFRLKRSPDGTWRETVIYRFHGPSGGPAGPVFGEAGNLFGTAPPGAFGFGGVFWLSPPVAPGGQWTETSVYDFHGRRDGAFPLPGLARDPAGDLYGIALGTGYGFGNVFRLHRSGDGGWTQSVLYDFVHLARGYTPTVGPILGRNGNLYGTTAEGGAFDRGVVFALLPRRQGDASTERVIHSFTGGRGGMAPYGRLTFGQGDALIGTTPTGGNLACGDGNGCGTIFRVVPFRTGTLR